jgi:hypothetical protein
MLPFIDIWFNTLRSAAADAQGDVSLSGVFQGNAFGRRLIFLTKTAKKQNCYPALPETKIFINLQFKSDGGCSSVG